MALSNEKKNEYIKRLLFSRMRILLNNGFYGLLLMHMIYAIDENCETASTDGKKIYFGPDFLDKLSDSELDYIMMHEILHVVLQHCARTGDRNFEQFNIACDIVVNSNILLSNNMDKKSITLREFGESMHNLPNGDEGYKYTAEQVYEMLSFPKGIPSINSQTAGSNDASKKSSSSNNANSKGKSALEDNGSAKGGSALKQAKQSQSNSKKSSATWDDHTKWGKEDDDTFRDVWVKRFQDACEAISIQDPSNQRGVIPMCAERLLKELKKPQVDWRTILNDFIQEEVVDYSFTPPDRRFDESPFFLPDFNEKDNKVEDILFMIDTSASMTDTMITAAYSEVKGAIDQFDGKLKGWLGFFDAEIVDPQPFADEEEFKIIKPLGGGGTDFQIIFEYIYNNMQDNLPASIIILTDGYAPFPKEKMAMGIPVLWLLNNEKVNPKWGKIARIKV